MPYSFDISLSDPNNVAGAQRGALLADISAAAWDWLQWFSGPGSLQIAVSFGSLQSQFLAQGAPGLGVSVGSDGTRIVTEAGTLYEMNTGTDPNGSAADINIVINSSTFGRLWLAPNPENSSAVPAGKIDATSVLAHEIGHGLGISGWRDQTTGALPAARESMWDKNVEIHSDGSAWFVGPNAEAVYGGPVPVTTLQNGEAYYHLGNLASHPAAGDLMTGVGIKAGERYELSALDLAIMKDVGGHPSLQQFYFGEYAHGRDSVGAEIYALYDGLLGRAPDTLGMENWASALKTGMSLHDLAQAFLNSAEGQARAGALDNATFVEQLYSSTLHRHSDPAGLQNWTDALAHGTSRADVGIGFALSTEHMNNIQGSLDAGVFVPDQTASDVARLYYGLLNRAPDGTGLTNWVNAIEHGSTLKAVAQSFTGSDEYQCNFAGLDDAHFVDMLYQTTLGRHAEPGGLQTWTNQLAHGHTRADVALSVAESLEAHLHLAPVIEQGWHLA